MHQLHLALQEDGELQAAVAGLSQRIRGNPLKHALILDLNPFWLAAYRFADAGLDPEAAFHWRWHQEWFQLESLRSGMLDLGRQFPDIERITNDYFGRKKRATPYLLRVFSSPATSLDDVQARRSLVEAAIETPIPTVIETQEQAQLVAAPGDKISATGTTGTLGGFLRDGPSGSLYAVSCGHVVLNGSVSVGTGLVGKCIHAKAPLNLRPGTVCTTGCPQMTKLDVALIDIGTQSFANVAKTVASHVINGDLVEMHGATTGKMTYEVGGAVVELSIAGYCWDKLFLIHAPTTGILPLSISVATRPVPKPGDSGAWILRNQTEWAGMVVARGGLHGYALAATTIIDESDKEFNTNLGLV